MKIRVILCLALVALTYRFGWSATVLLDAVKDNTLYGDPTKSNGAGNYIAAGRTNQTLPAALRRAVIEFDLSPIPAASVITDVTLCLSFLTAGNPGDFTVAIHQVQQEWGEGTSSTTQGTGANATTGDATWHHTFFATSTWNTDGGDYDALPSATAIVGSSPGCSNWTGPGVIQDVQGWLDDPTSNHGWILIGDEGTSQSAKQFASREHTTLPRPVLTVTYTAGSGAGAVPEQESEGALLLVDKDGSSLALSWGPSCRASDTTYEIYQGTIGGTFDDHVPVACDTAGSTLASVASPDPSSYFLIVPSDGSVEGSYGTSVTGGSAAQRPASATACHEQVIADCSSR